MNPLKIILFIFFNCFLLTGCFDKVELEEREIVLSVGIDKYSKDASINIKNTSDYNKFVVSLGMSNIASGSGSSSSGGSSSASSGGEDKSSSNNSIKTGSGISISSTVDLMDNHISKSLYFGHTKVVILGKEILSDEILLKECLDFLERNPETSRKIIVLGTEKTAQEILEKIPSDEKMLGIYLNDFYKNDKNPDYTYKLDLEETVQSLLATGDVAIPSINIVEDEITLEGLLLLDNFKLVGSLDGNLTKYLLYLINDKSFGSLVIPFENSSVSIDILSKKMKREIVEKDNKINISYNLDMTANISEYILGKNILIDSKKYKMVEDAVNSFLEGEIQKSIDVLKTLNVDALGLKEFIRKNEFELYNKYNLTENNVYDYVNIDINSNINIKNSGNVK